MAGRPDENGSDPFDVDPFETDDLDDDNGDSDEGEPDRFAELEDQASPDTSRVGDAIRVGELVDEAQERIESQVEIVRREKAVYADLGKLERESKKLADEAERIRRESLDEKEKPEDPKKSTKK